MAGCQKKACRYVQFCPSKPRIMQNVSVMCKKGINMATYNREYEINPPLFKLCRSKTFQFMEDAQRDRQTVVYGWTQYNA